ncbi:MAG: ABC transporter substrate-binding protein [Candidatus Protistobacter heckmanni]|nr:ABC transporter substrate-binding protein [Candidatus Protistobacter heckmanni]
MKRKLLSALVLAMFSAGAQAQKVSDDVVKIGVLTDLSSIYSDVAGQGSVLAAKMAVQDFSKDGTVLGKKVEIVSADHQNKADIAANKAREWYDKDKVDVIVDLVSTNTALAAMEVAEQKNKITLVSGAASLPITNEKCTAVNVRWVYDTYALSVGTAKAVVKQGKKNWFFLTADYAFGAALERDASEVVKANGGKVVGAVKHPFPGSDFSSFLLKAQASKADVIALANAGADTINSVKQAAEFGIMGSKQTVVPLLMFISDIHSIGLKNAAGMYLTEGFYWNRNDKTRAWSNRFFMQHKRMPTMVHAGVYSSVLNYLKAVQAAGTDETAAVMKKLKSTPIDDGLFKGTIREDGKFAHDMLLLEVKKPSESKTPWDYYNIRAIIPADEATQPLSASKCKLIKKS